MPGASATTARPFFPPRRLARDTVVRSAFMWVGVRGAYLILVALSAQVDPEGARPLPLVGPVAAAIVIVFVGLLVRVDARVCRETVLIANLGVRLAWLMMIAAGVASVLEIGLNGFASVGPLLLERVRDLIPPLEGVA
jgi:hypothetical protein